MILKICVVIPTFDNARTISEVVKDVLVSTPFPVLVVDDGSHLPVSNCLYSWEVRKAIETGRVRVERLESNQGKGAALRFAIRKLVVEGFTHMVTMDGDGQHLAREIRKLTDLARANPWDLIVGVRRMQSATVPALSKFGRKFSNFWVKYETGLHIRDSQSGFRLYPLLTVQMMRFFSKQFDFEIEVLIRLVWKGIRVREVDVDVHYPDANERVSHFHKVWDNMRISMLNVVLVAVSLMRNRGKPLGLATAAGVGVFIGCTPFYGFHTLLAIGVALLLRLNLVAVWLGSQISFPALAPLLIYAEVRLGHFWLNQGLGNSAPTGLGAELREWWVGSLLLGALLGVATWIVTFVVFKLASVRKKRPNWSGRSRGGWLGNGFLRLVLKWAGLRTGYLFLYAIVPYFYLLAPKAWQGMNEYWQLMSPQDSFWRRQLHVLRHYYRFGQVLMDRVFQAQQTHPQFVPVSNGIENIIQAQKGERGVILLTGHLGGWDLAASLLRRQGLKDHVQLVEFRAEGLSFQEVKTGENAQAPATLNTNVSKDAIFEIHSALKRGATLGLMGDRPLADRFELIPFLGRLAPFDMTPFRFAAAMQTPLLFTFGFKGEGDRYQFYARPARLYQFKPGVSRELQCREWAREFVGEMEGLLWRYPEQWFNFYPFWSSLPTSPNGDLSSPAHSHLFEELEAPHLLKPEVEIGAKSPSAPADHSRA